MKRILPKALISAVFLVIFCLKPAPVKAVNILEYFCPPGAAGVQMSNGEFFRCQWDGGCFTYQKSYDPAYYERFCIDGDSINHHEDTTWATAAGDINCNGNGPACLNFLDGHCQTAGQPICSTCNTSNAGMGWIGLEMNQGQCFSAPGTVIGQAKRDGKCYECCEAPYTGNTTHTMCLDDYVGCMVFPGENVCDDGIALHITAGPGAGEVFYYCRGFGWVGFTRGDSGDLNYPTTPLGGVDTGSCLVLTGGPPPRPPGEEPIALPPGLHGICGPSEVTQTWKIRSSWPERCSGCTRTGYQTPFCAQAFDGHSMVEYRWNICEYCEANETYYIHKPWAGIFMIDASQVRLPFAGKRKNRLDAERNPSAGYEDEIRYLADYLEGTHEYYRDYTIIPDNLHGLSTTRIVNHMGPLRKLTPYEFQNRLKKNMIQRAIASNQNDISTGQIRDYKLLYMERFCWHTPLYLQVLEYLLREIAGFPTLDAWRVADFCLYNASDTVEEHLLLEIAQLMVETIPFVDTTEEEKEEAHLTDLADHLPPSPIDFNNPRQYLNAWLDWKVESKDPHEKGGRWWKLWQVAPMVSRDDTIGVLIPVPELRSYPWEFWLGRTNNPIYIPHLARLFESSWWIQQTLMPAGINKTSDGDMLASQNQLQSEILAYINSQTEDDLYQAIPSLSSFENNPTKENSSTFQTPTSPENNQTFTLSPISQNPAASSKIRLAQVGLGCICITPEATYFYDADGNVKVVMTIVYEKCGDFPGGIHFQPLINGINPLGSWAVVDTGAPFYLMPPWTGEGINIAPGTCATMTIGYQNADECGGIVSGNMASMTCSFCLDLEGKLTSNCARTEIPEPPPTPPPPCPYPGVPSSDYCIYPGMTDPNPNDRICAGGISGTIYAVEEIPNPACDDPTITCSSEYFKTKHSLICLDFVETPDGDNVCDSKRCRRACRECSSQGPEYCCEGETKLFPVIPVVPCFYSGNCVGLGDGPVCSGGICLVLKTICKQYCCDRCYECAFDGVVVEGQSCRIQPCCRDRSRDVSRQIEIDVLLPYLQEIWAMTSAPEEGLFNVLRPASFPNFRDDMAKSKSPMNFAFYAIAGYASPAAGDFYFPLLGGTQLTKEWASRSLLPYFDEDLLPTPTPTGTYPGEPYSIGTCSTSGSGSPDGIRTAVGCINVITLVGLLKSLRTLAFGVGGGIAFLMMVFGTFQVLASAGYPKKIQAGKQMITSAIIGLVFIILTVFILRTIGRDIFQLPGFE
ncbi:pilin [Patescibacteria group bacterium]